MMSCFFDCGVHGLGASIFCLDELVHAEYLTGLGGQPHPLLEPAAQLDEFFRLIGSEPFHCGIEIPQVYDSRKQSGRQKDIVRLAIVAGVVLDRASLHGCLSAILHEPAEWKGQVDPEVMERRIISKLSEEERSRVELPAKSVEHNVWDGIGIGLVHHGRLGR